MTYASRNFLTNSQSSRQVHEMVSKAEGAGVLGCEDLAKKALLVNTLATSPGI
jgi:hypothetical protein